VNKVQHTQRGAVALITAIIVSTLLMITTAGMVSVTIKSLRQSTDGAQSTKAYYAAEGGLEEALLKIRNGDDPNACTGAVDAATSNIDGAVTCTKVTTKNNELVGQIGPNQTVQLDLSSVSGLVNINVEWSRGGDLAAIPNYTGPDAFLGQQNSSATPKWSAEAPAVVQVGIVEYPSAGPFSIDQVLFYESILAPKSSNNNFDMTAQSFIDYSFSNAGNLQNLNKAYIANCVQTGEYQCSMLVAGLKDDQKYVLRLKTRYNATDYRITARGAGNTPLTIPGAMYTIDVTARAGDVFRRVQTSFPVGGQVPKARNGLDYVLYSDTDICKSFQVRGSGAEDLDSGLSCIP